MQLNKLLSAIIKMVLKPATINWSLWGLYLFLFFYSVLVIDFIVLFVFIINSK